MGVPPIEDGIAPESTVASDPQIQESWRSSRNEDQQTRSYSLVPRNLYRLSVVGMPTFVSYIRY